MLSIFRQKLVKLQKFKKMSNLCIDIKTTAATKITTTTHSPLKINYVRLALELDFAALTY